MSGKVDPFELPREQDLAPPESAVDEATCPACSGEGCGEYARVVNAEFRCDGHGVVTRGKRRCEWKVYDANGRVTDIQPWRGVENPDRKSYRK